VSLLRRASFRWLARHPLQVALTVAGVTLGVAVVVAMDLAIQSAREAFRVSTETVAGQATHRVVGGPGGLAPEVFRHMRVELGLRRSAPLVEGWASTPLLPGTALRVLGVDPLSEAPFRAWLAGANPVARGQAPSYDLSALFTEPGSVVLARATAERAGLTPGDTMPLVVEGRARTAMLVGTLDPADALTRQGMADLLVMDVATAQDFAALADRLTAIDLIVPAGADASRLLERVRASLPQGARLEESGARAAALEGMLRAFDLNLTALSLLALVFGMFLIYNAMTFAVVQRRELFGALRAVGVTRRQIFGLVGTEALATGVLGTALGLGLGVLIGRGLVGLVTRTINDLYFVLSVEGVAVPAGVLVRGALLGLGATLIAAYPAVREAVAYPPRATLTRSLVEDRVRRLVPRAGLAGLALAAAGAGSLVLPSRSVLLGFAGLAAILLGMALLTPLATVALVRVLTPILGRTVGILGTLAARGVTAALSRTAPAVAALVVAVAVTVGLGVMIQSFRSTLVRWLDHTLQADVYVSAPSPVASRAEGTLDPALVERLVAAPVVDGVSTARGVELTTRYGPVRLMALDLDPRGEAAYRFTEGGAADAFRAFRGEGAVLVSEPFAYRHRVRRGNRVWLPVERGAEADETGGTEAPFTVAGVFTDFGSDRGVILMDRTTWTGFYRDDGVTSLGLYIDPETDLTRAIDVLRTRAGPDDAVVIRANATLRAASLEVFDRTFAITAVLRTLAFAVAFIGVLSALMALQLERGRELGVLRANGLTPGQVWTMVSTQTGVLGLAAGLLAVPVGLVLAAVMIFVINRRSFGWTLGMEVGPDVLLQAVGLALAGALLAGVYPAWRMSRTSPAVALREE
jgi:putative ABC transport system permease protein